MFRAFLQNRWNNEFVQFDASIREMCCVDDIRNQSVHKIDEIWQKFS